MKALIYTGIALVSVAAAYGMADYYGSSRDGSLARLYEEDHVLPETPAQPLHTQDAALLTLTDDESATTPLSATAVKKTSPKKKPAIRFEDFSRAPLTVKEMEALPVLEEPVATVVEITPAVPEKEPEVAMPVAQPEERKISLEKFSRAKPIARKTKASVRVKE